MLRPPIVRRKLRNHAQPGLTLVICSALLNCVGSLDDAFFDVSDPVEDGGVDTGEPINCSTVDETVLSLTTGPKGCAQSSCHSGETPAQNLNLESPNLISRLSGINASCTNEILIDPSDPANSYLYKKVLAGPYGCGGGRMPAGIRVEEDLLTEAESQCILSFLQNALNPNDDDAGMDIGVDEGVPDLGEPDFGPPDGGDPTADIEFEAEAMTLEAPFVTGTDAQASGGVFVYRPNGAINGDGGAVGVGRATYTFVLAQSATVRVFGRVRTSSIDNDSFWVRMDQAPYSPWNDLHNISGGNWVWDDVHDTANAPNVALTFPLTAGSHTLEFAFREANAQLDRVIITQDSNFQPPN